MLWPQQQSPNQNQCPENRPIVEIECCQNCKTHVHLSAHHQKKYQYFYKQIQRKLHSFGITVQKKHRTLDLAQLLEISTIEQKNAEVMWPRMGAFEIYFNQELIFSKLQTNTWPNPDDILKKIIRIHIENKSKRQEGDQRMKKQLKLMNTLKCQSKKSSFQYKKYIQSKNRLFKIVQTIESRQILSKDSARNRSIYHSVELKPKTQERNAASDEYSDRFKNFMSRKLNSEKNYDKLQTQQKFSNHQVQRQKYGHLQSRHFFTNNKFKSIFQKQPQTAEKIHYHDYRKRLSQKLQKLQNLQTYKGFVQIFDIDIDAVDQNVRQIKMERHIDKARRQLKQKNKSREHQ